MEISVSFDPEVQASYIRLGVTGSVARTTELDDRVMVDFDADGTVLGVEILGVTGVTQSR